MVRSRSCACALSRHCLGVSPLLPQYDFISVRGGERGILARRTPVNLASNRLSSWRRSHRWTAGMISSMYRAAHPPLQKLPSGSHISSPVDVTSGFCGINSGAPSGTRLHDQHWRLVDLGHVATPVNLRGMSLYRASGSADTTATSS